MCWWNAGLGIRVAPLRLWSVLRGKVLVEDSMRRPVTLPAGGVMVVVVWVCECCCARQWHALVGLLWGVIEDICTASCFTTHRSAVYVYCDVCRVLLRSMVVA